jgi:two-component system, NarL family, nitrate/nitrite response regulator NarL
MMKIVVGDRHEIVSSGIASVFDADNYNVVARCSCLPSVSDAIKRFSPDLVLIGQNILGSGSTLLRELRKRHAAVRIVVMLDQALHSDIAELTRLGVQGLILKQTSTDRLLECVRTVGERQHWVDPDLLRHLLQPARDNCASPRLSLREMQISRFIAQGLRNKEIARQMDISEATVKMHLHHIYDKLHLANRTELALHTHNTPTAFPNPPESLPQPAFV